MIRVLLVCFAYNVIYAFYKASRVARIADQIELYITLIMMLGK